MNKHTVGVRLLRLRNGRELSLRKLEEMSGINKSTLHKWETDKAVPTREGLQVLSGIYNVQASWLLFGQESKTSSLSETEELLEQLMLLSPTSREAVKKMIEHCIAMEKPTGERNGV